MDHDSFEKLVQSLGYFHASAREFASIVIIPLFLFGIVFGLLLTRWIFRGGLSRRGIEPEDDG
jgi:hypothetical protein